MKRIFDTVGFVYIQERKLLLVRDYGSNAFLMPGGKIEENESQEEALMREVKEELDVTIKRNTVNFLSVFEDQAYAKPVGVRVRIHCYTADFEGDLKPSSEIEELKFLTSEEYFSQKEQAKAGIRIFNYLREEGIID